MDTALTAEDLAPLDNTQKEAVFTAIYVALIADGAPNPAELAKFTEAIEGLPWGQSIDELKPKMHAVQTRLAFATREDKIAFLEETVPRIPVAIREHVIQTMIAIAAADNVLTKGEKGSLAAFIRAFGWTDAQVAAFRAKLGV